MAAAIPSAGYPTTRAATLPRGVRLIRVIVLLLGGFAITFTATMHEQLSFDLAIATVVLALLGISHLVEWLLACVSIAAAAVLPLQSTSIGFAVVVAAWALISALLEFVGNAIQPGSRQDATVLGATGVLLAILSLVFREDPVAVVGLLGAYAVIGGVFLGISAFDNRRAAAPAPTDLSAEPRAEHSA